jgi:hypothetical protein
MADDFQRTALKRDATKAENKAFRKFLDKGDPATEKPDPARLRYIRFLGNEEDRQR